MIAMQDIVSEIQDELDRPLGEPLKEVQYRRMLGDALSEIISLRSKRNDYYDRYNDLRFKLTEGLRKLLGEDHFEVKPK